MSPETPTETDDVVEEAFGLDGDLKQLLAKCEILVLNPGQLTVGKGSFGTVIQATWRGNLKLFLWVYLNGIPFNNLVI